ncbi:MAG: hypothetical protein AAFQ35_04645, partial [Pseudomonadota bacterium]
VHLLSPSSAVAEDATQSAPKVTGENPPATQSPDKNSPRAQSVPEGSMTIARMGEIVGRLDSEAKGVAGRWQFSVEKRTVLIVTDVRNNRMRIMVPVRPASDIAPPLLKRLMQANFDTALDSRYAIANDILWATFIHPLRSLHDRQFIEAIGQTVNLAETFGTTFSSGLLSYGGGDSRGIIERQLIDGLLERGLPI